MSVTMILGIKYLVSMVSYQESCGYANFRRPIKGDLRRRFRRPIEVYDGRSWRIFAKKSIKIISVFYALPTLKKQQALELLEYNPKRPDVYECVSVLLTPAGLSLRFVNNYLAKPFDLGMRSRLITDITFELSQHSRFLSVGGAFTSLASTGVDLKLMTAGKITPVKFGLNTGITALGFLGWPGLVVGIILHMAVNSYDPRNTRPYYSWERGM